MIACTIAPCGARDPLAVPHGSRVLASFCHRQGTGNVGIGTMTNIAVIRAAPGPGDATGVQRPKAAQRHIGLC